MINPYKKLMYFGVIFSLKMLFVLECVVFFVDAWKPQWIHDFMKRFLTVLLSFWLLFVVLKPLDKVMTLMKSFINLRFFRFLHDCCAKTIMNSLNFSSISRIFKISIGCGDF